MLLLVMVLMRAIENKLLCILTSICSFIYFCSAREQIQDFEHAGQYSWFLKTFKLKCLEGRCFYFSSCTLSHFKADIHSLSYSSIHYPLALLKVTCWLLLLGKGVKHDSRLGEKFRKGG